ncbi:ComEC/Rec2 family competence protein [Nocardia sp. NPDC002869]|uniref:ComEC/Rec2 family competence protein n=1 Tax=Nocardia sp. NPDC002869 TaxID=3161032 RepID=UPI00398CC7F7
MNDHNAATGSPESGLPILSATILDVGHGNSAVVRDGDLSAVIDAAPGDIVLRELERVQAKRIEHLVISHSDQDHAGGGPKVLLDDARTIGTVWFNADARKNTRIWRRLLHAVHTRVSRGGCDGHQMLHTEIPQTLRCGRARLEVCHPSILMAGTGPTKESEDFGRLDTNTVSIVIRVHLDERPAVLLAADMDAKALDHIRSHGRDLAAPVLVFPHHGGLPGSADPETFANTLTELVAPELVIFSIRSGPRPANPNHGIVMGVRRAAPKAHIACTQLSVHCHDKDHLVSEGHLAVLPADGRRSGRACVGSVMITSTPQGLVLDPPLARHREFVDAGVSTPLCRATLPLPRRRSINLEVQ